MKKPDRCQSVDELKMTESNTIFQTLTDTGVWPEEESIAIHCKDNVQKLSV